MLSIGLVLLVIALVLLILAAVNVTSPVNLMALAGALVVLVLLIDSRPL